MPPAKHRARATPASDSRRGTIASNRPTNVSFRGSRGGVSEDLRTDEKVNVTAVALFTRVRRAPRAGAAVGRCRAASARPSCGRLAGGLGPRSPSSPAVVSRKRKDNRRPIRDRNAPRYAGRLQRGCGFRHRSNQRPGDDDSTRSKYTGAVDPRDPRSGSRRARCGALMPQGARRRNPRV